MIFLVVLGHIGFKDYGLQIQKVIYSFHIPVFVFLSGFLSPRKIDCKRQKIWLLQNLLIYAGTQAAYILLTCYGCDFSWDMLIVPAPALWYFVSLIFWRLFLWYSFKGISDVVLLLAALLLALACGFIPLDREFSFQRTFAFLPFFITGVIFRKRKLMLWLNKLPLWVAILVLLAGLMVAHALPWNYQPKFHYVCLGDMFIRLIQTFLAFALCLSVVRLIHPMGISFAKKNSALQILPFLGRYTLWVYIGHLFLNLLNAYVVILIQRIIPEFSLDILSAVILAVLYCAICTVVGMICKKLFRKVAPNRY